MHLIPEDTKLMEFENISPLPGCECGCPMNPPSGRLVLAMEAPCFNKNGRRASWTLRVHEDDVIRLTLDYFRSSDIDAGQIWVKIHDGPSNSHNLLAFLNLNAVFLPRTNKIHPAIISSTNAMKVELAEYPNFSFLKRNNLDAQRDSSEENNGFVFVASFESWGELL